VSHREKRSRRDRERVGVGSPVKECGDYPGMALEAGEVEWSAVTTATALCLPLRLRLSQRRVHHGSHLQESREDLEIGGLHSEHERRGGKETLAETGERHHRGSRGRGRRDERPL
jgi:hypothetical protein